MSDDKRATWEQYASAWKLADAKQKRAALAGSVDENCVYRDPLTEASGHQELVKYMLEFHEQIPGGHFATKYFLTHHDRCIAKWNMVAGDGTVLGDGVSYGEYNEQGKLIAMTGFFETPAS